MTHTPIRLRSAHPAALVLAALGLGLSAGAADIPRVAHPAPTAAPIPVILDTDIGGVIDDTWALVLLLKSPELDLRLVTTAYGDTVYRAKIVARLLEIAGRTDVPIGVGVRQDEQEGGQAEWVYGYDLARYPGRVVPDGVQALIDTAMAAERPMTLIAIGPGANVKAALEREPRIAGRLRLVGLYGSLRMGYDGEPQPTAEWNVHADPLAARALLDAPWAEALIAPLDTAGLPKLDGENYARVRRSEDPLLRALVENFRLWCRRQVSCARDPAFVTSKTTTLHDTVAVYLAFARNLVRTEELGVRVTDEGRTVLDETARPLRWATEWRRLDAFESFLAARLTGR